MIKTRIQDGLGEAQEAHVTEEAALLVTTYPCPPLLPQKNKVFSQFITDDGTSTGSEDLGVDGSVNPIEYWIPALDEDDLYITKLSFIIGYFSSAQLWEFADANVALNNGVLVAYDDTNAVETIIVNAVRNSDFLKFALTDGIIPTAWELRHLGAANDYGFLFSIDLTKMLPPFGIKLDRGTVQRISITIRDDCTDADDFNCRAFGFERMP